MAPKKNAFSIFISQHINDDIVKGIKPTPSFQQVATRLTPVWNVSKHYILQLTLLREQ